MAYTKPAYKNKGNEDGKNTQAINELKLKIKNKDIYGVFVLWGQEEYLKRYYYSEFVKICGNDAFNSKTIDGKSFSLSEFVNCVSTVSGGDEQDLFSDQEQTNDTLGSRLVRVINPDFSDLSEKDISLLCDCLGSMPENTSVVFYYYADKSVTPLLFEKGVCKRVYENALVCEFKYMPENSPALVKWCGKHFENGGVQIQKDVLLYFCSSVGNDMSLLENEIQKLCSYVGKEERPISKGDIDKVCIKTLQAQVFDVSSNTVSGNYDAAMKSLKVLKSNKTEPLNVFGAISKAVLDLCNVEYYAKNGVSAAEIAGIIGMKEYPVKKNMAIIENRKNRSVNLCQNSAKLCASYDEKLKSMKTDGYELLSELIFKLCYCV